jgi:hypothetical protein
MPWNELIGHSKISLESRSGIMMTANQNDEGKYEESAQQLQKKIVWNTPSIIIFASKRAVL